MIAWYRMEVLLSGDGSLGVNVLVLEELRESSSVVCLYGLVQTIGDNHGFDDANDTGTGSNDTSTFWGACLSKCAPRSKGFGSRAMMA